MTDHTPEIMAEAERLLPCPFCEGRAEIQQYGTARISTIYSCTECGCKLETGETFHHGTRWNTCSSLAARDAAKDMEREWQPIATAPKGVKIWARMGDWVCTTILHEDEGHWTDGATVLHYNGATLVPGFRGPFTHWMFPPSNTSRET